MGHFKLKQLIIRDVNKKLNEKLIKLSCYSTYAPFIALWPSVYSQENWVGVCGLLPKTLTQFMTKICDILLYIIYDLTRNMKSYL